MSRPMLHDFLTAERENILSLAKSTASNSQGIRVTTVMEEGWSVFYSELIGLMKLDAPFASHGEKGVHTIGAEEQGKEYLRLGYTISEVVHSYGLICQAITATASEKAFEITSREFQQLNLSLDTAIAEAVTEYDKLLSSMVDRAEIMRLGDLARELRNSLQNATIALELIESGNVGVKSSTGAVLKDNMKRMGVLVDISLTEVRLRLEPKIHLTSVRLSVMMGEVGITSGYEARDRSITLQMIAPHELEIEVDKQLFVASLANLVHNAIKFSKRGSEIMVRAEVLEDRVRIGVEDHCGGLRDVEKAEAILKGGLLDRRDHDTRGLGLRISKLAIERNGGTLSVENRPGHGCTFYIELPTKAAH